jgi:hypothetical protein
MACELGEKLAIRYLAALDMVAEAKRDIETARNSTLRAGAETRFRRLEDYRLSVARELVAHRTEHACPAPELKGRKLPVAWYENTAAELRALGNCSEASTRTHSNVYTMPKRTPATVTEMPAPKPAASARPTPLAPRLRTVLAHSACVVGSGCLSGYIIFIASA